MKCIVIYFSQTGNTEKVAIPIREGVKQVTGHCDLAKIKDINPHQLDSYDLIGLGCPVFDYEEPLNVRQFINSLRFVGGKHAFMFSTHGCLPEYFFPAVVPRLQKRVLIVIGMRDWYSKVYLAPMPDPYPTEGHPDLSDLMEAEAFGREMAEHSSRISLGEAGLIPATPTAPLEPPLTPPMAADDPMLEGLQGGYASMLEFHEEDCLYPDCRLCMDNCPMDGIDLTMDPPVIARPCIRCTYCARICPTGALDDSRWVDHLASVGHELIESDLLPVLDRAESDGRFRRLLPTNQIGYDTLICQTYKKRPQWIIGKGLNG
jgi:NAD-dependent dihydropyrimidine dehydrogenase PreA subunit